MANNTYMVYNEGCTDCIIIDPSFATDRYERALSTYGLKCAAILLTHGHCDHIGSVGELKKQYNCPVYIHRDDADMLTDSSKNQSESITGKALELPPADHILEDGATFSEAGLEVKVIHTPGHTPGSVCYIIGDHIFTGDTLFAGSIGRTDLPGGDYDAMMKSLNKLKAIEEDYVVCPGHMESSSMAHEKANNYYMHYDISED